LNFLEHHQLHHPLNTDKKKVLKFFLMTFPSHYMANNHDTPELERLMDLPVIASTSAHSNFQQLINQVEPLTRVVLATQVQNQVLLP
jgi:hypothetical protein